MLSPSRDSALTDGYCCPRCLSSNHQFVLQQGRSLHQCKACRHQTSLSAGTILDSTKLPLQTWFLAIYLISRTKTVLSALALKRHLGINHCTAWLIHQKPMHAMAREAAAEPLHGDVLIDDSYLGRRAAWPLQPRLSQQGTVRGGGVAERGRVSA